MKILDSGVEMTHEELRKSKAGANCACGCDAGHDSSSMWELSRDGGGCVCGCTTGGSPWDSPRRSAFVYLP